MKKTTKKISESDLDNLYDFLQSRFSDIGEVTALSIHFEEADPVMIFYETSAEKNLENQVQLEICYVH
jgi:hypothetical protein